jgi:hypothetical protein
MAGQETCPTQRADLLHSDGGSGGLPHRECRPPDHGGSRSRASPKDLEGPEVVPARRSWRSRKWGRSPDLPSSFSEETRVTPRLCSIPIPVWATIQSIRIRASRSTYDTDGYRIGAHQTPSTSSRSDWPTRCPRVAARIGGASPSATGRSGWIRASEVAYLSIRNVVPPSSPRFDTSMARATRSTSSSLRRIMFTRLFGPVTVGRCRRS